MTNKDNTVFYTGVTNNLITRAAQPKQKIDPLRFTAIYKVNKLVYYEIYNDVEAAIIREKQINAGSRIKKIKLIESMNPDYKELYEGVF
jgi:putative endonuclease